MSKNIEFIKIAIALGIVSSLMACSNPVTGETSSVDSSNQSPEVTMQQETQDMGDRNVTLTGVVMSKPWSPKSYESWNAGGDTYYVLDVGEAELDEANRSAEEGTILRGSDEVPWERFAEYEGETVEAKGTFIEAQPYVPKNPMEQYPIDMNGDPLPRGSGFQVTEITIIE